MAPRQGTSEFPNHIKLTEIYIQTHYNGFVTVPLHIA